MSRRLRRLVWHPLFQVPMLAFAAALGLQFVLIFPFADNIIEAGVRNLAANWPLQLEERRAECLASPGTYRHRHKEHVVAWFVDAQTGGSANPDAPAVPADLVERARAHDDIALRFNRAADVGMPMGGLFVVPVADQGPCSAMVVTWNLTPETRLARARAVLFGISSAAAVVALVALVAIAPLWRRLLRLDRAAARVGDEVGYVPGGDDLPDVLGRVFQTLDASHRRVLERQAELDASRRLLSHHLDDVAHDLHTPLALIHTRLEELHRAVDGDLDPQVARCREDLFLIDGLVDNLQAVVRLQDDPDRDASCDLSAIVARWVARGRALGEIRGVEFDGNWPDSPVWVGCEAVLAERLLSNLVVNAVVHNRLGGHSAVKLSADERTFRLEVIDDGPGVPEPELERLVRRRYRPGGGRPDTGQGLGLAIVAEVSERSGWDLTFAAAEPSGLQVVVRGPLHGSTPS